MRIAGITDIHGSFGPPAVEDQLGNADLILVSGDITHFGGAREAEPIIARLSSLCSSVYAVSGNCDNPDVGALLRERGISLEGTCARVGNLVLVGLGGSLPGPSPTPNEYSEEELRYRLEGADGCAGSGSALIMVSHQPPFGTLNDRVSSGKHVGSASVREFVERHRPAVCLCGHIHEAAGIDRIGGTVTVNPGPLRGGGVSVIEIDDRGLIGVSIVRNGRAVRQVAVREDPGR